MDTRELTVTDDLIEQTDATGATLTAMPHTSPFAGTPSIEVTVRDADDK